MKIRWDVSHSDRNGRNKRLVALLVNDPSDGAESVCMFLGSIELRFLTVNIPMTREFHQGLFWKSVTGKLDGFDLDPQSRERIEAQISAKVPKPGDDWPLWGVTCIPRYGAPS